jgi:hypothetical protein
MLLLKGQIMFYPLTSTTPAAGAVTFTLPPDLAPLSIEEWALLQAAPAAVPTWRGVNAPPKRRRPRRPHRNWPSQRQRR